MPRTIAARLLVAACTAALLAGCAAVPGVHQQVAETSPAALGLRATDVAPVAADWWTGLGDPQLDRIMTEALAANPTLDEALARVRVAEAGIAAQKAAQLPQISADASEQRERLSGRYIIPPPYAGSGQWVGTAQANLSWSLDLAGKQKALVDAARASGRAAALDAAAARIAISGAVAQTYVNYARADAEAKIAGDFVASRQNSLQLARIRQQNRLASDFDISAAETLLAQARQAQVRAEGNRALMVHALAALAGHGADYYGTIAAPSLVLTTALPLPRTLPADLLGRRADILAARARIEASEAGRRVARAQFFPDVDIRAFAGSAALGLGALFSGGALTAGVGPAIHLPIFEGGALRANYTAAVGQIDVSVAAYNDLVVRAVRQAADALSAVDTNAADAAQQRAILANLQTTVHLDEVRYRTGLGGRLDVLDSGDRLLGARQSATNIDADGAIARIQLAVAMGGGFSPDSTPSLALNGAASAQR